MARYIDINEIKFTGEIFEDRDGEIYIKLSDVKQSIEQTPTADVVEVKHGEWSHLGDDEWYCTNCGVVITTEGSWEKPTKNYCFECGAQMDGTPKERGGEK